MLRLSEIYLSVQGEGPRVGEPTVFVRFAGCNLRCPGWPCDTQFAIEPSLYRHEWTKKSVEEVLEEISKVADDRKVNICFTGGEPFLQQHDELEYLTKLLLSGDNDSWVGEVECFSNGTLRYPPWAFEYISFIMDWKLRGSGEDPWDEIRFDNLNDLTENDAVKFVIKDRDDFNIAEAAYRKYILPRADTAPEVFYGVVWDAIPNETVVGWVLDAKLPWRLNLQTHNYVFDRTKRGI